MTNKATTATKAAKFANLPALTKAQEKELQAFTTTSGKIRYLTNLEWKTGEVAVKLGIIYQWAYNVRTMDLAKAK